MSVSGSPCATHGAMAAGRGGGAIQLTQKGACGKLPPAIPIVDGIYKISKWLKHLNEGVSYQDAL